MHDLISWSKLLQYLHWHCADVLGTIPILNIDAGKLGLQHLSIEQYAVTIGRALRFLLHRSSNVQQDEFLQCKPLPRGLSEFC